MLLIRYNIKIDNVIFHKKTQYEVTTATTTMTTITKTTTTTPQKPTPNQTKQTNKPPHSSEVSRNFQVSKSRKCFTL